MKKGIAVFLSLLLLSGCTARLPQAEPFVYEVNAFPHDAPKEGGRVTTFIEEAPIETPEGEASPEKYMEAVALMTEDEFAAAAELLSVLGDYRNADRLADICKGLNTHDFDRAVEATQWVDALGTFTYDDEYVFKNYHLESYFSDIFEDYEHEESVDALNAMLEAVYYAGLSDYDSAYAIEDALSVAYSESEDSLLSFQNVTVSGWMKEALLENCAGKGTGKVLIAEKGAGSGDSFKLMKSNMMYALPNERIPRNLDEVEYVLFIDDDYDRVGVYTNGAVAIRYKITLTVKQYPGGNVVYDSGLLIGEDPDETVYITGPVASVPGKLPDMTSAQSEIERILGLDYAG